MLADQRVITPTLFDFVDDAASAMTTVPTCAQPNTSPTSGAGLAEASAAWPSRGMQVSR